jgi:hypothetical protein
MVVDVTIDVELDEWLPRVTLNHDFLMPNVPTIPSHLSLVDWATYHIFILPHVLLCGFSTSWFREFWHFLCHSSIISEFPNRYTTVYFQMF